MTKYTKTKEYQEALQQYKTNLEIYQSDTEWYFGAFENGMNFFGEEITTEQMQRHAKKVSPIGPEVPVHKIEDVTPSWEEYKERWGLDYSKMMDWIESQDDIFLYERGRETFNPGIGLQIAGSLGYRKIIMQDLS